MTLRAPGSRAGARPLTVLAWPLDRSGENPYTNNLYAALRDRGIIATEFTFGALLRAHYDILHVHWPEGVLPGKPLWRAVPAALAVGLTFAVARLRGARVVWTVHNERPHRPASEGGLRALHVGMRMTLSGLLFLSDASREEFSRSSTWARRLPSTVTPHGRFGVRYPQAQERRSQTRAGLGVTDDETLVAFLGRMESYKGPLDLVRAYSQLPSSSGIRLLLAGTVPSNQEGDRLREAIKAAPILTEEAWLDDERFAELSAAADLVVYPYRRILNSGSILVPVEYSTPVLAPDMGSIPEVSTMLGGDWIRVYDGPLTPDTLATAATAGRPDSSPNFDSFEWAAIAASTERFFSGLLSARRRRQLS
ncbi:MULTISPECIES: glycosyltransferase [Microbacterium]|uniref:glycosyltransferase n=1 Tax=Microbacterium TaxID=33882 RepID=UPI00344BD149